MPNSTKIKDLLRQKLLSDQKEIELLIAHVLQKPREFILAHPEHTIDKIQTKKYKQLITKRLKNIPLAYLTGHKEFFGLDFLVNKNVLIPRSDTELMVELVLENLKTETNKLKPILIDVGTGSGCIPISIIKTLKHKNIKTFAIDISPQALTIARKNAYINKTKIKFLQGDLLSPLLPSPHLPLINGEETSVSSPLYKGRIKEGYLIITANLPYLTPQQFKQESSIQYEPKTALVAGHDGLKYYHQLLKQIKQNSLLTPYSLLLFLEIDPSQTSAIKKLIKKYLPEAKIAIHQDLTRRDRMVEIYI